MSDDWREPATYTPHGPLFPLMLSVWPLNDDGPTVVEWSYAPT